MKVLLIGGTGILSTDVCLYALSKGMTVYCINRGLRKDKLPKGAHLIVANIRNQEDVLQKVAGLKFDVIVDFLSYTPKQLKQSLSVFSEKCDQYVFISTAVAYCKESEDDIITEDFSLGNDKWLYGKNKADCEALLKKACKSSGLSYTIVRPYVTYGDTRIPFGITSDKSSWSLANRILTGKPIVLWDSGKAICTLTHTRDFAVAMVGLFKNPCASCQAYHITSNERLTWKDVLEKIEAALNKRAVIIDMPTSKVESYMTEYRGILSGDKATNMRFDNSKICAAVPEFKANIDFKTGIQQTIDFFLSNRTARKIDYVWDGRLDRMIEKYSKKHPLSIDQKTLEMRCFDADDFSKKNELDYRIGRNAFLYNCNRILNKIR